MKTIIHETVNGTTTIKGQGFCCSDVKFFDLNTHDGKKLIKGDSYTIVISK